MQETILSIAKQSKKNLYDPEQGSFKTWLMNMTRWRINDQFRKRKKDTAMIAGEWENDRKTAVIDRMEDPNGDVCPGCGMWSGRKTWPMPRCRVKAQVSPKQYQIFDCYVVNSGTRSGSGPFERQHGPGVFGEAPGGCGIEAGIGQARRRTRWRLRSARTR